MVASWVLNCPLCNTEFTHSEIGSTLEDYYLPLRPTFPSGGLSIECPNCKEASLFQQNELTYRRE